MSDTKLTAPATPPASDGSADRDMANEHILAALDELTILERCHIKSGSSAVSITLRRRLVNALGRLGHYPPNADFRRGDLKATNNPQAGND